MTAKRIAYVALLTAIALVLHVFESALPPLLAFAPGAKMGLSNVISLIALFILGVPDAYVILLIRCVLGAIFGGNLWSLVYSLPAGIVSLTVQVLLVKAVLPRLSITAISFIGALLHNTVQLAVASLIVKARLLTMLPLTLLASIIAGLFVGLVAYFCLRALPSKFYIIKNDNNQTNNSGGRTQ